MNPKFNCKYLVIFTLLSLSIQGQNLIPNPSFEQFVDFRLDKNSGWHKVQSTDTPDYFNLNSNSPFNNIFDKYSGNVKPKSGDGFVGLFCYRTHPVKQVKNVREFIQTEITNNLEYDSVYRIEVSLWLDAESNVSLKNLGIFLGAEPIYNSKEYKLLNYKPQVEFTFPSPDCRNKWITFSSFYKATGNEKYLMVGNFRNDRNSTVYKLDLTKDKTHKEKWDLDITEKAAYYYLDDLVLEKISIQKPVTEPEIIAVKVKDSLDFSNISIDSAVILKNIFFDFNKSELLPQSYKELQNLYLFLINNPSVRIRIEGHTDNMGGYNFNLQLSRKRAESVVLYLLEQGISAERIESAGFSYALPLASNETSEGRQINRRVAFKIIAR